MPKVSVIVPVYNGADHLRQHVAGLLKQTLDDMEVIFVNDASTDDSWNVLRAINYMNPERFKIINSGRNRGPGGARNLGIEAAKGEYIGFVDCDDDIDVTMFEKMYNEAVRENYDVVECAYTDVPRDEIRMYTGESMTGVANDIKRNLWIVYGGFIFTKLIRRDILDDPKLKFRENIAVEDADFLIYLFSTVNTVGNVMEALYRYNNTDNSASLEVDFDKAVDRLYKVNEAIYGKVSDLPVYERIRGAVEYIMTLFFSYAVKRCVVTAAYINKEKIKNKARDYLKIMKDQHIQLVKDDFNENKYVTEMLAHKDVKLMNLVMETGLTKKTMNYAREKFSPDEIY